MDFKKLVILAILFLPLAAFAQNQVVLPEAGLTPESPFYFLDRLGEALREFFTFDPEAKAKLQITLVGERIAEIKVILETKGVEVKGLGVARTRLEAHLAKILAILEKQKAKGQDVQGLAVTVNSELEARQEALEEVFEEVFEEQERVLEAKAEELKAKIRQARLAGDTAQLEALLKELREAKAQLELLELEEERQEEALEDEEERLEEELEAKEGAEKAIAEAEKEKQEILDEAAEEGLEVPPEAFEKFNRLLAQAKELFDRGNFQGARQLAKAAEKSLDQVGEALEDLEEAQEREEELREEQEEMQREAQEEEAERLQEEQKRAQEEVREAEERLREAGEEDDKED